MDRNLPKFTRCLIQFPSNKPVSIEIDLRKCQPHHSNTRVASPRHRRVAKIRTLDPLNFRGKIGFFSQNLALSSARSRSKFFCSETGIGRTIGIFYDLFFPPVDFSRRALQLTLVLPVSRVGCELFFLALLSSRILRGGNASGEIRERKKLREKFLRVFSASCGGCDGPGSARLPVSKPEIGRGKRSGRSGGSSNVSAGGFLLISSEPRPAVASLNYCDSEEFHEQDYMVLVRIQTHC